MTNGEKMIEVLHDFNFEEFGDTISGERYSPYCKVQFDRSWWNSEYKEPTTKNDLGVDCISRQSVLDKIQRLIDAEQNNIDENGDYMNYARERVNAYEAIQFFVENDCLCPSVTPQEPRKGHWIDYKCDKCGYVVQPWNTTNFCPNCGSRNEVKE